MQVTDLSGYLYKFSKDERRVKLQEALTKFQPPRSDLYIPTNPEAIVKRHIASSGACMQSAAKVSAMTGVLFLLRILSMIVVATADMLLCATSS